MNATLANEISLVTQTRVDHDSFVLIFEPQLELADVEGAVAEIRSREVSDMRPQVDERAIEGLKFSECLPNEMALDLLERRLQEPETARRVLEEPVRFLIQ